MLELKAGLTVLLCFGVIMLLVTAATKLWSLARHPSKELAGELLGWLVVTALVCWACWFMMGVSGWRTW